MEYFFEPILRDLLIVSVLTMLVALIDCADLGHDWYFLLRFILDWRFVFFVIQLSNNHIFNFWYFNYIPNVVLWRIDDVSDFVLWNLHNVFNIILWDLHNVSYVVLGHFYNIPYFILREIHIVIVDLIGYVNIVFYFFLWFYNFSDDILGFIGYIFFLA